MASTYSDIIRNIITSTVKLDNFTEEEKTEVIDFLEDNCVMQIHIDLLKNLSKKDKDLFYEISEHRNPARIRAFLEDNIPGYKEVIQDSARKTVQEFVRMQQP
jgi:hypothetical protein